MPRTFKTNCNTKTKIDHGGIRNRYARFGLDVRRLKPGLYFVRRSTQTLLRKRVYADMRVMGVYTHA